jgi:hypothetical protein
MPLGPIVALLRSEHEMQNEQAARTLLALARIGASCCGSGSRGGSRSQCVVWCHARFVRAAAADGNLGGINAARAIGPLVALLRSPSPGAQEQAARAIRSLARIGAVLSCDRAGDARGMLFDASMPQTQAEHRSLPRRGCCCAAGRAARATM